MSPSSPSSVTNPAHVAGEVRTGLAWGLLNNAVLRLASLVSGIVLARILTPEDYGVYAIALTVLVLLQSANELGAGLALVQRPGDVRAIAPTVATVAITSSVVMYAAVYAFAPALCDAINSPDAVGVIRIMSIAILPDGIGRVPFALLTRYFLQRRMFVGEAIAFVCNIGVTIPLAVNGAGAYSFAWGVLVGGVAGAVSHTCLAPFRAWPGWDRREAGTLLRFGLPLAGASLIELAVGNVDNLVVGAVLGQTALGYYLLAFRQSTWPLVYFAEAARRVSLAGFSRLVDESDVLTRAFTRGLGLLVAATVPACVGLAVYAEPVIRLLYGDRWIAAAQALSVLAVFCQLRIVLFVAYDLLVALGRSSMLAALQVLWLVALIPSLVVGARLDGIRGAAIAHTIIAGAVVIPAFLVALRRVGIPPSKVFGLCTRPLFGAVAMVLVGWPITRSVDGDVAQLALGCASVVVVYLPFVWPMRSLAPRRADPLPARVAEF